MNKRFSEGQIAFSEMDGSTHVGLVVVGSDPTFEWIPVDSADYNGDGMDDLLLFSTLTRQIIAIPQDNGTALPVIPYGFLPATQDFVNSGDYDGDEKPDLLVFEPSTGNVSIALQDGTQITSTVLLMTLPFASWVPHSGRP